MLSHGCSWISFILDVTNLMGKEKEEAMEYNSSWNQDVKSYQLIKPSYVISFGNWFILDVTHTH